MSFQTGKQILIAEDHTDTRRLLELMLRQFGYAIIEAVNGKEAVSQAVAKKPDLILMDISMPELDGIEAIKQIRSKNETSGIPIIGLTAQTDEYIEDALDAGCSQIIRKPIDWETLEPIITEYLGPLVKSTPLSSGSGF